MSTITPGTSGSLQSTTLENALNEAIALAISYELDATKNPQSLKNLTQSYDLATNTCTATFTFPLSIVIDSNGRIIPTVTEYLSSTGFTPGNPVGTIKSSGIAATIVEVCERIQTLDRNSLKNPSNNNTITGLTYDSEALTVTGAISFGIVPAILPTGIISIVAKQYLLD